MRKIRIDSIGRTIQVPSGLSNDQYDAMVQEAIQAHGQQSPDTKGFGEKAYDALSATAHEFTGGLVGTESDYAAQ